MKSETLIRRLITLGVIVIIVSSVFCLVGQSKMSAADKELKASYQSQQGGNPVVNAMAESAYASDRRMYYLPGEKMRDNAGYGIIAGIALIAWGFYLNYKRKKDSRNISQVKDLLDEHRSRN
jgi:hypothetical protein